MLKVEEMARFAHRIGEADLSESIRQRLKIHLLDTLGCALGALEAAPTRAVRHVVDRLGGHEQCTLFGGGRTALPLAALHNGALVRYLDFMDAYLAAHGECHPSDNVASLLAAAELGQRTGQELLTAMAVAYQILCRLSQQTAILRQGFDHTTTLTFSIAAGVSKLLGLDLEQTINALAIAGADAPGTMATRTEPISNWKGIASAEAAYRATLAVLLAREGITGPRHVFEGPEGLEKMTRDRWKVDWRAEKLDLIDRLMIKKYNGEARSQSAIDAALHLRAEHHLRAESIAVVRVDTFRTAYDNLGGGKYGSKDAVHNKEQADHNLRYMIAVAMVDGELGPRQYQRDRLNSLQVRALMDNVVVKPKLTYSWRDPDQQPTRVRITLADGRRLVREQREFDGFPTRPVSWDVAVAKFERLAAIGADASLRRAIIATVGDLENLPIATLAKLLGRAACRDRAECALQGS